MDSETPFISTRGTWTLVIGLFIIYSCGNSAADTSDAPTIKPDPVTVTADTVPPPVVINLATRISPRVIRVPKATTDGNHSGNAEGYFNNSQRNNPIHFRAETSLATFINFDTEDGLALSAVWCGTVDSKGNLWFGTGGGGVSRFDGKKFTTFSTKQGLAHNAVWFSHEDKSGNLWFGTTGGGISCYNGIRFTNYTSADGLAEGDVRCMAEDRYGHFWFGTLGGGVSRFDGEKFFTFTKKQGLADDQVWSIAEDNEGFLLFGTPSGLSRYDGQHFTTITIQDGLPHNDVRCIYKERKGTLWFGTWGGGVSRYDGKRFTNYDKTDGLAHDVIWCIQEDSQGNIWFGTRGGGASKFDGENFITLGPEQGLAHGEIMAIIEDKNEYLWFATYGAGVCRFNGDAFSTLKMPDALSRTVVFNIAEDRHGILWLATHGAGVIRFDGKHYTRFTTTQGLPHNEVWAIYEDKNGHLWFGTNGGICQFNGIQFTNYDTRHGLHRNEILSVTQDKSGNMWFGGYGGGISMFDGKQFTVYTTEQGLSGGTVMSMTEDRNGNMWIATVGGLCYFDGQHFKNYSTEQGLAYNNVLSILEDHSGNLWFGTYGGGASRYDGNSFKTISTPDGLADEVVYDIAEDKNGVIWFGTNLGYSGLKFKVPGDGVVPDEIIGAGHSTAKNDSIRHLNLVWEHYNTKTGYPVKDLNTNAMCISKIGLPYEKGRPTGIVWGGFGDNKVIRFTPDKLKYPSGPPPMVIHSIKIDEEPICWYTLQPVTSDSVLISQQEATVFGRKLISSERDTLKRKFGDIRFDGIRSHYPIPENLVLPYRHNRITVEFGAIETSQSFLIRYQYMLEGYDKGWNPVTENTTASFGNMDEGIYHFKVKAMTADGKWGEPITYSFQVLPPWYRSWYAYITYFILFGITLWLLHEFQKKRALKKVKEKAQQRELEHAREIESAFSRLETAHENLKNTQSQLIQSEKMASLGALTAGIAHEIQNPLNFVNNFSEINTELITELKKELTDGNLLSAEDLVDTIKENEEKISHHGKRAEGIVKSMLQHSRISTGKKELTDINKLADEYIRLAYHGMRAKDKSFRVDIKTEFAPSLPSIEVVPQDIGRVILNLITNAFYAVSTPKYPKEDLDSFDDDNAPLVIVQTRTHSPLQGVGGSTVEISISDNGPGIPNSIKDKIFQPFFTTKPTGQGTGLGLSLSYDIVKAHGGELTVETKENEYTRFIIRLPSTKTP